MSSTVTGASTLPAWIILLFEAWGRNADALVRNRRFLRRSSRSILGLTGDERIVRAEAALIADGGVRVPLFLIADAEALPPAHAGGSDLSTVSRYSMRR